MSVTRKGKETRERRKGAFVPEKTEDWLRIERRQTRHTGKWWIKKVKEETLC